MGNTLAILVKLSGRNHDLDTAFAYVDTYKPKYNVEPNVQVHLALLTACACSGDMDRAEEVFQQLRSPDSKAYAAIVTGYLKTECVKDRSSTWNLLWTTRCSSSRSLSTTWSLWPSDATSAAAILTRSSPHMDTRLSARALRPGRSLKLRDESRASGVRPRPHNVVLVHPYHG